MKRPLFCLIILLVFSKVSLSETDIQEQSANNSDDLHSNSSLIDLNVERKNDKNWNEGLQTNQPWDMSRLSQALKITNILSFENHYGKEYNVALWSATSRFIQNQTVLLSKELPSFYKLGQTYIESKRSQTSDSNQKTANVHMMIRNIMELIKTMNNDLLPNFSGEYDTLSSRESLLETYEVGAGSSEPLRPVQDHLNKLLKPKNMTKMLKEAHPVIIAFFALDLLGKTESLSFDLQNIFGAEKYLLSDLIESYCCIRDGLVDMICTGWINCNFI